MYCLEPQINYGIFKSFIDVISRDTEKTQLWWKWRCSFKCWSFFRTFLCFFFVTRFRWIFDFLGGWIGFFLIISRLWISFDFLHSNENIIEIGVEKSSVKKQNHLDSYIMSIKCIIAYRAKIVRSFENVIN